MLTSKNTAMIKYIKTIFVSVITAGLFVSCDTEADFDIPNIINAQFYENFDSTIPGSGATENAIALAGWSNFNVSATGTRLWHSRALSDNKYAEFSSFYSAANTNDEAWLVTPTLKIDASKTSSFAFDTKVRFWTGSNLTIWVSENYDGTKPGIATATWKPLNAILPTATTVDKFISSGKISLEDYKGKEIRVAFKYVGSKTTSLTTTFQIDNVKLFAN